MTGSRIFYDREADGSYISLADIGADDAVRRETHCADFVLNFGREGHLLGLEVWGARIDSSLNYCRKLVPRRHRVTIPYLA